MSIECYKLFCEYHPVDEGPFWYENYCRRNQEGGIMSDRYRIVKDGKTLFLQRGVKQLICPFSPFERHCGDWCPLFEFVEMSGGSRVTLCCSHGSKTMVVER